MQSPIAAKALGIGKHVLCGYPAGPRERDALRMVHASRYYPRLMSIMCHGLRFLPAIYKMRTLIEEGFIGKVHVCEIKVRLYFWFVTLHKIYLTMDMCYSSTAIKG